jgi:hypothetical protein
MGASVRPANRDQLVDALRGVCFVFMTVDHFPGSPFVRFSNPYFGPFGFFTAALGFVLLSGFVSGFVYEGCRVRDGFGAMTQRVVVRVGALYVTQLVLYATPRSKVRSSRRSTGSGWRSASSSSARSGC